MHTVHHVNLSVKNKDLFVPFVQTNLSRSSLTCFNASIKVCLLIRSSVKIDPPLQCSQFSLVGDGVNNNSLTEILSSF